MTGNYDPITTAERQAHRLHAPARSQLIALLLRAADLDPDDVSMADVHPCRRIASRLSACCRWPSLHEVPSSGQLIHSPGRCNSRLCPLCGPIRARQLGETVRGHVGRLDRPRLITLTLTSAAAPLADQLARLRDHFRELRRSKAWREHVTGGITVTEITYNPRTDQWHPHLHVVCDGAYWPQGDLSTLWYAITGDSKVVDIRACHDKRQVARYVAKYLSKTNAAPNAPDRRITEWAVSIGGLRLAQTFGTMHGARTAPTREKRTENLDEVCQLAPLIEQAREGNTRARRLLRAARLSIRLVRNVDPAEIASLTPRLRRVTLRLRAWWGHYKNEAFYGTTARPRAQPKPSRAPDRQLWDGKDDGLPPDPPGDG